MTNVDYSNPEFRTALSFINQTNRHIFLTGKAGTGKTTFLRYIKERSFKKMAIVAPTGVAAINAGGVTIHSFFQIPPGLFLPTLHETEESMDQRIINRYSLLKHLRLSGDKKELLNELELLVIDEISMVRADLLDAVDAVLRYTRKQPATPFGGVQVLYIGDLFQLPPVVRNGEWKLLSDFYQSPFFFDAQVIREEQPLYIELKKVYRQKDDSFISILNNIRNNTCEPSHLQFLHKYYQPDFIPHKEDHYITLTTHNDQANLINQRELRRLPGQFYTYKAKVTGDFPENSYPAEEVLQLKKDAQIMFIKNDKGESRRFFNGKIGTIHKIEDEKLVVAFPDEPELLELKKETWENIRYTYSKERDRIEEEELGSFVQYPIRLAWAITIHKSQGLTFEKAVIDAGAAFAAGQVYVALSRLTSLDGLVLKSRIYSHCIQTDERVLAFVRDELPGDAMQEVLLQNRQDYIKNSLIQRFGWEKLIALIHTHIEEYDHRQIPGKPECLESSLQLLANLEELQEVSGKFQKQLQMLLQKCELDQYQELDKRVTAACSFFTKQMEEKLIAPLSKQIEVVKIKSKVARYLKELGELKRQFEKRKQQFEHLKKMVTSLRSAGSEEDVLASIEELHKPLIVPALTQILKKKEKGDSHRISLKMFKEGMSIADIAEARSLVTGTIESHLAGFITTGEVDVLDLVEEIKLKKILSVLNDQPSLQSTAVKEQLGEEFTYGEIRAAIKYKQLIRE
jgi:PIF1-like helicase/Helix-turn-helix domain/Helicase